MIGGERKYFHGINNLKKYPTNETKGKFREYYFRIKRGMSIAERLWKEIKKP